MVNIVTAGETGSAIVEHPGIDKIATGSTAVGKKIANHIAGTGKKLTLELGGKSSSSRTPRSIRRSRGLCRDLLQPGPRLLRQPGVRAGERAR